VADLRPIRKGRRAAIAEITGSLMMIALTIIAGAAVFGWAISQAGVSENALGQNAAQQANYYHESFVMVSVQFSYNGGACQVSGGNTWCNQVSVAVYNNGGAALTVQSIVLANASKLSASGSTVPKMRVSLSLTSASTGTYSMPSYTCGSTNGAGSPETLLQSGVSEPIAIASSPPTMFTFTLPASCGVTSGILDGALYSVQVVGLYGNIVTSQVTANG